MGMSEVFFGHTTFIEKNQHKFGYLDYGFRAKPGPVSLKRSFFFLFMTFLRPHTKKKAFATFRDVFATFCDVFETSRTGHREPRNVHLPVEEGCTEVALIMYVKPNARSVTCQKKVNKKYESLTFLE